MDSEKKWYRGGLAFSCKSCGQCCSGPAEGYVWLTTEEISQIAEFLEIGPSEFQKKYVRAVGSRFSLVEKHPSNDCVFLKKKGGNRICAIYLHRPEQCRTWPFWNTNLLSPEDWQEAAGRCPGIDQGKCHSLAHIEAVLEGRASADEENGTEAAREWITKNLENEPLIKALRHFYQMLDRRILSAGGECDSCGSCCDFQTYGHRLYVTTLEMLYFQSGITPFRDRKPTRNIGRASPERSEGPISSGCCPYQGKAGCEMRNYRPAGCRIFFCQGMPKEFQSDLTEESLHILRELHEQFGAVYNYMDWLEWLKNGL